MLQSIVIFVLIQITLLARYLIKGEFEPGYYAFTYVFLILPIVLYFFGKHYAKKELHYTPQNIEDWSFYNRQSVFLNEKPLFKGNEKRGSIQRYFDKKWQYFIWRITDQNYFLSLKIWIDHDEYNVKSNTKKLLSSQDYWQIYKNGVQIGSAKTVVDLKNTAKLKEVIELQIGDKIYSTAASTVVSSIKLFDGQNQIGQLSHGSDLSNLIKNVKVLKVQDDTPEKIIALLIHAFYFKNN